MSEFTDPTDPKKKKKESKKPVLINDLLQESLIKDPNIKSVSNIDSLTKIIREKNVTPETTPKQTNPGWEVGDIFNPAKILQKYAVHKVKSEINKDKPKPEEKEKFRDMSSIQKSLIAGTKPLIGTGKHAIGDFATYLGFEETGAKLRKEGSDYAKDVPMDDGSLTFFIGSAIPSVIPSAAAVGVHAIPAAKGIGTAVKIARYTLPKAVIGGYGLSAFGAGSMDYIDYQKEKGREVNELHGFFAGLAYSTLEVATERFQLKYLIGKKGSKIAQNQIKKKLFRAPADKSVKAGKHIFEQFTKTNPKKAKQIIDKVLLGSLTEGGEELIVEIGQDFVTRTYKDEQDWTPIKDLMKHSARAFAAGALMGSSVGVLSYQAQNVAHRERRAQQGHVNLAKNNETGEAVEIIGSSKDSNEFTVMNPSGSITTVKEENLSDVTQLELDRFEMVLKDKQTAVEIDKEKAVINEIQEIDQSLGDIQELASKHGKDIDGNNTLEFGEFDGERVIVGKSDVANPGMTWIFDENAGNPRLVDRGIVENIETIPTETIISELNQNKEQISSVRPLIKGEKILIPNPDTGETVEARIAGIDPDNDIVNLEIGEEGEIDYLQMTSDEVMQMRVPFEEQVAKPEEQDSTTSKSIKDIKDPETGEIKSMDEVEREELKKEVGARKIEINDKEYDAIPTPDGSFVIDTQNLTKKEADKLAAEFNDSMPRANFEVVDNTDTSDPFAKSDFKVVSKPNQTNNEEQSTETKQDTESTSKMDSKSDPKNDSSNQKGKTEKKAEKEDSNTGSRSKSVTDKGKEKGKGNSKPGSGRKANTSSQKQKKANKTKKKGNSKRTKGAKNKPVKNVKKRPAPRFNLPDLQTPEDAIAQKLWTSRIKTAHIKHYGDPNWIKDAPNIARQYGKKDGKNIDQFAMELAEEHPDMFGAMDESDIIQRVVEFIADNSDTNLLGYAKRRRQEQVPDISEWEGLELDNETILEMKARGIDREEYDRLVEEAERRKNQEESTEEQDIEEPNYDDVPFKKQLNESGITTKEDRVASVINNPFGVIKVDLVNTWVKQVRRYWNMKNWKNVPTIKVHNSVYDAVAATGNPNIDDTAQGFYTNDSRNPNTVHVVASNTDLNSYKAVQKLLLHEVTGHYGLRGYIEQVAGQEHKEQFNNLMDQVSKTYGENELYKQLHDKDYKGAGNREISEEFIAHLSENYGEATITDRLTTLYRQVYRSWTGGNNGDLLKINDAEIRTIIHNSRKFVKVGRSFAPRLSNLFRFKHTAWNGGGYNFDEFSTDHVGKGSGLNEYGYGLYFGDKKYIALKYANQAKVIIDPDAPDPKSTTGLTKRQIKAAFRTAITYDNFLNNLKKSKKKFKPLKLKSTHEIEIGSKKVEFNKKELTEWVNKYTKQDKFVYQVDIQQEDGSDPNYMEWEEQISEENLESIRTNLKDKNMEGGSLWNSLNGKMTGKEIYNTITKSYGSIHNEYSKQMASLLLLESGIHGNKYKYDGGYNFVLFDDRYVDIIDQFIDIEGSWESSKTGKPISDFIRYKNSGMSDMFGGEGKRPENSPLTNREEIENKLRESSARLKHLKSLPPVAKSNLVKEEIHWLQKEIIRLTEKHARSLKREDATKGGEAPTLFKKSPPINTREFQEWFKDSKVVEEDGRPKEVYHGTWYDFDIFTPHHTNISYFAENPEYSTNFAQGDQLNSKTPYNVMPVYLAMSNPLDTSELDVKQITPEKLTAFLKENGVNYKPSHLWYDKDSTSSFYSWLRSDSFGSRSMINAIKKAGYDGIIQYETYSGIKGKTPDNYTKAYVIFSPYQAKSSIGNRGTYRQDLPDIRFKQSKAEEKPKPIYIENEGWAIEYPDRQVKDRVFPGGVSVFTYNTKEEVQKIIDRRYNLRFKKADPVDSKEFKEWFKDSKVVDDNGEPKIMFHSTKSDFDVFDIKGKSDGFFFGDHPGVNMHPNIWDQENPYQDGSSIMPVYLSIKNPMTIENGSMDSSVENNAIAEAKEKEHDGLYIESAGTYVAFNPNQIKSAIGNQGTFDGSNPDIRYKRQVKRPTGQIQDGQMTITFNNRNKKLTPKPELQGKSAYRRVLKEDGSFNYFTGAAKIETAADVAYIFRDLENQAVEQSFIMLVNDKNEPVTMHVATGDVGAVMAPLNNYVGQIKKYNTKKVYFIHNHPSGNLSASTQDMQVHNNMSKYLDELNLGITMESIVINLDSGKYIMVDKGIELDPKTPDTEVKHKVYNFNNRVFYEGFTKGKINTPNDVAEYLSAHRHGLGDKMGILVMSTDNKIIGNFAAINNENIKSNIAEAISEIGGRNAILYSNSEFDKKTIDSINNTFNGIAKILDYIHVMPSSISEVKVRPYGQNTITKYADNRNVPDIRFKRNKPLEQSGNLIALHNLTESNLLNAEKIGGLPMPSMAILNKDVQFTSFGDISLIAPTRLIDPKNTGNRTYASDIYSPRYPSIVYDPELKKIENRYGDVTKDLPFDPWDLSIHNLISAIEDKGKDALEYSTIGQLAYLKANNKRIPKPQLRAKPKISKEIKDYWNEKKDQNNWGLHEFKFDDKLKKMYREHTLEQNPKLNSNETLRRLFDNPSTHQMQDFKREIERAINPKKEYKVSEWKNKVDEKVRRERKKYEAWINKEWKALDVDEKIFKGYSYSGNKRHAAHTLDNIMKELRSKEIRGGENYNYGVGTLRSSVSPQFKSIKQIVESQDKLVSEEDFDAIKKEVNDELIGLADKFKQYYNGDVNSLTYYDSFVSAIMDGVRSGYNKSLEDYYWEDINPELISDIQDFVDKIQNMPTEYFESKPNRPVRLYEFKGAVVPRYAKEAVKILRDNNVEVRTYNPNNPNDRQDKINKIADKYPDIRFKKGNIVNADVANEISRISLRYLQDPMFQKMQGRQIKKQTIEQVLNQDKVKRIEKEIIKDVLKRPEFQSGSFSFDLFKVAVETELMPLTQLTTTSWSSYGMGNVGLDISPMSIIYNSHLSHGFSDHFSGYFETFQNIEYELKEIPGRNTYIALQKDIPDGLIPEQMEEYVGTAGSKKHVEEWIELQKQAVDRTKLNEGVFGHTRRWVDKNNNQVFIAELQSDPLQKKKAELLVLESMFNEGRINKNSKEYNDYYTIKTASFWVSQTEKSILRRLKHDKSIIDARREKIKGLKDEKKINEYIQIDKEHVSLLKYPFKYLSQHYPDARIVNTEKGDLITQVNNIARKYKKAPEKLLTDWINIGVNDKERQVIKSLLSYTTTDPAEKIVYKNKEYTYPTTILYGVSRAEGMLNTNSINNIQHFLNEITPKDLKDKIQNINTLRNNLNILFESGTRLTQELIDDHIDKINKTIEKDLVRQKDDIEYLIRGKLPLDHEYANKNKKEYTQYFEAKRNHEKWIRKELPKLLTLKDKQFIAHQKNFQERILAEEIRTAADNRQDNLMIPTPRTIALIEGFISNEGNAPYTILSGEDDYLESGDVIDINGEEHYVVEGDGDTIEVLSHIYVKHVDQRLIEAEALEKANDKVDYDIYHDFGDRNTIDALDDHIIDKGFLSDLELEHANEEGIMEWEDIESDLVEHLSNDFEENMDVYDLMTSMGYRSIANTEEGADYPTMYYNVYDNTETLNQPIEYDDYNDYSDEEFEDEGIDDLASEHQTVVRKYQELYDIFKKMRGDNIRKLKYNGYSWYSTKITEEDRNDPVLLFKRSRKSDKKEPIISDQSNNLHTTIVAAVDAISMEQGTYKQWKDSLLDYGITPGELEDIGFVKAFSKAKSITKGEITQQALSNTVWLSNPSPGLLMTTEPGNAEKVISMVKYQDKIDANNNLAMLITEIDSTIPEGITTPEINRIFRNAAEKGYSSISFADLENPEQVLQVAKSMDPDATIETISLDGNPYDGIEITPKISQRYLAQSKPKEIRKPGIFDSAHRYSQKKDYVIRQWQDMFIDMKRLQEGKAKEGKLVDDTMDAYTKQNISKGIINDKQQKFEKNQWKPLKEHIITLIKGKGITLDQIQQYLKNKHAIERNKFLYDQNPDIGKAGSGITTVEAKKVVEQFEKVAGAQNIKKLHEKAQAVNRFILETNHKAGLISKQRLSNLSNQYDYYVPLRGWNDGNYDPTVFANMNIAAKGRTTESGDPLPYLLAEAEHAITMGEQNKVKQALLAFVKAHPDPEIYEIKTSWFVRTGYTNKDGMEIWNEQIVKPSVEAIKNGEAVKRLTGKNHKPSYNKFTEETLSLFVNGQKVSIIFKQPHIAKAFKNATNEQVSSILSWSKQLVTYLRMAYTQYSPEFSLRNFFRDVTTGLINVRNDMGSKDAALVLGKVMNNTGQFKHLWNALNNGEYTGKDAKWLREYVESGSITGYSDLKSVSEHQKALQSELESIKSGNNTKRYTIDMFNKLLKPLDEFNRVIENMVRFSAYKHLRTSKGATPQQAAIYAKDLTVNFNRKGNLSDNVGSLFLFFNAAVQGNERLFRPFGVLGNNVSPQVKKRAIQTLITLPALNMMLSMMNRLIGGKDEDDEFYYDKLSTYTRQHNIILPNIASEKEGDFITIPLPYGFNTLFALSDHVTRAIMGKEKVGSAAINTFATFMESFSPLGAPDVTSEQFEATDEFFALFTPTALKPVMDIHNNKNFAGSQIYREPWSKGAFKKPDSEMYFNSVNPLIRKTTTWLNKATGGDKIVPGTIDLNPEWIEHAIESYTGGAGKFITNSISTLSKISSGEFNPDNDLNKVPFAHSYIKYPAPYYNQSEFYNGIEEVETAVETLKRYAKTDRKLMVAYYQDNVDLLKLENYAKGYKERVSKYRDLRKVAERNKDFDRVNELDKDINNLYLQFLKMYNDDFKGYGRLSNILK